MRGLLVRVSILGATAFAGVAAFAQTAPAESVEERLARLEREVERQRSETSSLLGKETFERACAACHGTSAKGNGAAADDLDPRPRDLTVNMFRFRTTTSGSPPLPADLERTIRRGLPGSAMPGFDGLLSDAEISELVVFLAALQASPGAERPSALAIPTLPPSSPESIRTGHVLYTLLECWRCHGITGDGRGPSARGLVDDEGRPIRSTDFRHDPLKGGHEPADVARSILTGLNGSPMPSYGDALVFAREDFPEPPAFDERIPPSDAAAAVEYVRTAQTRSALDALGPEGRNALRDERLGALVHYVLSLDRRDGFWSWLVHQEPEQEPR